MRFLVYLMSLLFVGTAIAQNPTILQGSYISNVFGQSNFILNPNAQTNIANVTTVTATVTRSTTTPLVATSEFTVAIGTANGTATWATRAFDAGMKGQNCEARFSYRGFQATSKVNIKQGANTVATLNLTPATDPRIASINFPCGDLSTATTFVVTDTAILAGTNEIGGIYTGLATNMANVAQAENVVQAFRNASQTFPSGTPTAIQFNSETKDVNGEFDTANGVFKAKRAGDYLINSALLFDDLAWTAGQYYEISIRKNNSAACRVYKEVQNAITMFFGNEINCTITLAVGDYIETFVDQNRGSTASNASSSYTFTYISRLPTSSELVVTPERQNTWGGVVYDDSTQTQFFGTAEPTAFTSFNNATWNKPTKLKGKASVTTTNSGNDLGFSVDQLPVGNYKVTLTNGFYTAPGLTDQDAAVCVFRVRETTTNTIIGRILLQGVRLPASNVTQDGFGVIDGVFTQTSLGQRNFILEASKTIDSSASNWGQCVTIANSSAPNILSFTITPLDQPSNSALYVEGPVKASATGAAIPAGYQGQVITTASAIATTASTTSEADVTNASITLTPGVWQIFSSVTAQYTSGTTSGNSGFLMVTVTDSANTHIGNTERIVYANTRATGSISNYTSLAASTVVSIASNTTYKLRQKRTDSSGTGSGGVEVSSSNYDSTFYAIRLN